MRRVGRKEVKKGEGKKKREGGIERKGKVCKKRGRVVERNW